MLKSCTLHKFLHLFACTVLLPRQTVRSEAGTMVTAAAAATDAVATQRQQATDGRSGLWYFAFGSMCNPTSLSRRGLFPTASHPAQLQGYKLAFELGGMANITPDQSSSCHGILHHVTAQEFEVLKEIESNYGTAELPVTPYTPCSSSSTSTTSSGSQQPPSATCHGISPVAPAHINTGDAHASNSSGPIVPGVPVTATAFIVSPERIAAMTQEHPEWGTSLPSDRYIRIITAGLRHFGADPAWIQHIAAQPCKHGRQPHAYLKLPVPDILAGNGPSTSSSSSGKVSTAGQLPVYTMQQLQQHEGKLQDNKTVFAVGPKVVELDVSAKPDGPFVHIIQKHFAGKQIAFHMCMMLHEPRLPPIHTPADVCKEHIEWAEDSVVEFLTGYKYSATQIGWLAEGEDGCGAGGADAASDAVQDAAQALHEEDEIAPAPDSVVFA